MTYCKVLYKLNTGSYISSYTVPIHHKWIGVCECACGFYFHIKDCMDSYRKGIDEWKWWFYDVNGVVWGTSQDVSDWFCWFVRFGGGWFVALPLVNNNLGESFRPPPPPERCLASPPSLLGVHTWHKHVMECHWEVWLTSFLIKCGDSCVLNFWTNLN